MRFRSLVALVLLAMLDQAGRVQAQQPRVVGMLTEIVGPVYLRPSTAGQEILLDAAKDVKRTLFEGQAIRCDRGGRATLTIAGAPEVVTQTRGRFEIRYPDRLSDSQRSVLEALTAYGRPGATRGVTATLYSPADASIVKLEMLDVRWSGQALRDSVTLELLSAGRVVWTSPGIVAGDTRLPMAAIAALRRAIQDAEGAAPGATSWTIVLRDTRGGRLSSQFRTLSPADESALAERLRSYGQADDPALGAIERAFEFSRIGLVNQAADELDRALGSAPRSLALLRAAIGAHDRTGNQERVRELMTRLGSGA